MSLKPPLTGTGPENDTADLPFGDSSNNSHDSLDGAATVWPTRPNKATRPIKTNDRASQAINDAQEGLSSLFQPRSSQNGNASHDDSQPHIISPSGATRNHTRGRVAGPTATPITKPHSTDYLAGYLASRTTDNGRQTTALVVDSYEDSDEIRDVPQTRLGIGVAKGKEQLQVMRQRASLLIAPGDGISVSPDDSAALQSSRRAAARWVTRYATHIVIVLIVGLMVAVGGLTGMTQGSSSGMLSADSDLGTDHIEADHEHDVVAGKPDLDSSEFEITLPRTELNGINTSTGPDTGGQVEAVSSATVSKYTIVAGDTIASVAKAFKVMPETIMGSNGIYDSAQDLTAGETLNIPPVDGMYYVPAEGDTLEGIAQRFGVHPEVIASYAPNNIAAGGVKTGQAIVVPGGMMPPRDVTLIYTVNPGDTLRDIAARFGVDVPTMINSNDIPDPDSLQIGSELRVLPVAGIEYKVKKGDTLRTIAERTGVSPQTIIDYSPNRLALDSVLQIDQVMLVPGGRPERIPEVVVAVKQKPATNNVAGGSKPASSQKVKPKVEVKAAAKPVAKQPAKAVAKPVSNKPKVATGRMVWPVQGRITQYFSGRHNGLDIAIAAGTPIHAADAGKIIWSGWRTDGLGYCVMIDHGNGLTTIYGHMIRQPPVRVGQYVDRGQVIGNIGSTGRSTGPHVHFMVKVGSGRNYRNPLSYLGGR
ncbi:MAG TPA: LysM peptidoglycan-binding domain-containing protein [Chloroflexia bacterium]|nr:LysM peptidoglycan-binding domain-containing protein [Chloroflexia bacterium]